MLADRFRDALGERLTPERAESVAFAVEFAQLLVRILPDEEIEEAARAAMRSSIAARTDLEDDEIEILLDMVSEPVGRMQITDDDLRVFGGRFGHAEEEALRRVSAQELDLKAFAERYGAAESLLLLDSLFAVCGVDGVIDRQEIGRLTKAAGDLGVDAVLIGALFRKHDIRHASGDVSFELTKERYLIGRDPACDVPLTDPQVAMRHAELVRIGDAWRIVDLGSGRPTVLNGEPVSSAQFHPDDRLRLGSYTLVLAPDQSMVTVFGQEQFSALSIRRISRRIDRVSLLDDVSFTAFSGEVIAVVGPSGAGKTTLLNAIAGIAPADSGDVIFDGESFHKLLSSDRSIVGNVPQDDVVHAELTVRESLFYAGRLRYPPDAARAVIQTEVDRVLQELGIDHIQHGRIGDATRRGVSGGQKKRVNLGQELLTRSTRVLFLDEPTTGLDPQTAQEIVSLIRQLADHGRIVFIVTHDLSPSIMAMIDHLMVLAPGGRLAWFGPPSEADAWFDVRGPDEIFGKLATKPPTEWASDYRGSVAFKKYVRTREHLLGLDGVAIKSEAEPSRQRKSRLRQFLTLTGRYARVKWRDRANLAVLIGQAPILAIAMAMVFEGPEIGAMFMLALSALWFGASSSVRELITERTIWRREARAGLSVNAYIASKVMVLGVIVAVQCAVLSGMLTAMLDMRCAAYEYQFAGLFGVTMLTGMVGLALGLLMSALFSSSEAAVGALPLFLIPQITFSGLLVKLKHMGMLGKALSYLMFTRYSFEALMKTGTHLSAPFAEDQRQAVCMPQMLYQVGFRTTTAVDDVGLPMEALVGILAGSVLGMLALTAILTKRAARGN